MRRIIPAALLAAAVTAGPAAAQAGFTVYAAASTTNVVKALAKKFEEQTGTPVTTSFAASGSLAKQIAQGAPADVYISANVDWMDHLEENGHLVDGTRRVVTRNALVLVAPAGADTAAEVAPDASIGAWLGDDGRLALGDPQYVPAGDYARTALKNLGLWQKLKDRAARANDVRAALRLVETWAVPLGVVYATDAALTDGVQVVDTFPADSYPAIRYPAALTDADSRAGRRFLDFLTGGTAQKVFRKAGFRKP